MSHIIGAVMLVVWGLAFFHCDLEQLPGFSFLACCDHPDSAPHQDDDCQKDACSVVEYGFYKVDEHQAAAPVPLLFLSYLLASPVADFPMPDVIEVLARPLLPPPELPVGWRFSLRTALSPRAPAVLS